MSHFTVLVVGEDPEGQLSPYSENLVVPEYETGEVSKEDIDRFIELYTTYNPERTYSEVTQKEASENKKLTFPELYQKYGDELEAEERFQHR